MLKLLLKSVDRTWHRQAACATDKFVVLSPYLTPSTADSIIGKVHPSSCQVYTVFSIEAFAARASSLRTIRSLVEQRFSVFHVEGLHAKIVYSKGKFASVGSQNMTSRGRNNLEANAVTRCEEDLSEIARTIYTWTEDALRITKAMIKEAEQAVAELEAQYTLLRQKAESEENKIFEREGQREIKRKKLRERKATALRNEKELADLDAAYKRARKDALAKIRGSYEPLTTFSGVSKQLAKDIIRVSAQWDHPSGSYVRAPKHCNRLEGSNGDWRLPFGANTFNVSRGVIRCSKVILEAVGANIFDIETIKTRMRHNLTASVSRYNGVEYSGGYNSIVDGRMIFGTQAIHLEPIINRLFELGDLETQLNQLRLSQSPRSQSNA